MRGKFERTQNTKCTAELDRIYFVAISVFEFSQNHLPAVRSFFSRAPRAIIILIRVQQTPAR